MTTQIKLGIFEILLFPKILSSPNMKKNILYLLFLLSVQLTFSQLSYYDLEETYIGTGHPNHVTYVLSYDLDNDDLEDLLHIQGNELFVKKQENGTFIEDEVIYTHSSDFYNFSNKTDINDDGYVDFLIATENSILVFHGTSEGIEFGNEINAQSPQQLQVIDLNKDGNTDIIYNSSDLMSPYINELYFIEGNNDGSFASEIALTEDIEVVNQIKDFKIDDVEKDGDLDIVIREFDGIHVLLNDEFSFYLNYSIEDLSTSFSQFEIGDFNLDGLTDVVVTDQSNNLHVYSNRSTTLEKTYTYETINLASIISVDYDNNGRLDLIVSNIFNSITFISNNGDETFADPVEASRSIPKIVNPSLSDFNNDGHLDIVATGNIQTGLQRAMLIPLNPGLSTNIPFISVSLRPYVSFRNGTVFEDLDNDGYADITTFSKNGGVYIFYGTEDGFESDYQFLESPVFTDGGFLEDIDNDGDIDIITRKHSPSNGTNGTDIIFNDGNRTYQNFQWFKYLPNPSGISLVDIDNNGTMNLACHMSFGKEVVFLEPDDNTADYFDNSIPRILTNDFIESILYEDYNGDSWVDVIISLTNSDKIQIHLNDQVGGFESPIFFDLETGDEATAMSLKDLDGDNKKEFIIATTNSSSDPKLKIFKRVNESNPFELDEEFIIDTFSGATNIVIDDFDGDGNLDFYLKNTPGFYVYSEDSSPKYVESNFELSDFGSFNIGFRDFNNDGFKDFVRVKASNATSMISINNTVVEPGESSTTSSVSQSVLGSATLNMNDVSNSGRLVLISTEESDSGVPQDGIFYASNPSVGVGTQIGNSYVVYSGDASDVDIINLTPQSTYFLRIFEYNVNEPDNSIINYRTSSFTAESFTAKESQSLSYPNLRNHLLEEQTFEIEVISSAGLTVSLELVSGPITLENNEATITGLGTVVIKAIQEGNDEFLSAEEEYEFEIVEALSVIDSKAKLIVAPNPFESFFTLKLLNDEYTGSFQVLEVGGKVIKEGFLDQGRKIEMIDAKPGVYILRLRQKGESSTTKIIKAID